jgi:uncharacterized membrane protein YqgA involved in biofilm formation
LSGHLFGKALKERHQTSLTLSCGVSVLFIGIAGAMQGMLTIQDGVISSGQTMLVTLCLAIGTLIGEIINIEDAFERFGEWLKIKSGNAKDKDFVNDDGILAIYRSCAAEPLRRLNVAAA